LSRTNSDLERMVNPPTPSTPVGNGGPDGGQLQEKKGSGPPGGGGPGGPGGPRGPPGGPGAFDPSRYKPKSLRFWLIMLSNFLANFLVALDRTIIATAIPQITNDFKSLGDIGWYGSAYMLTTAASQLLFGRIFKFYNTKWLVPRQVLLSILWCPLWISFFSCSLQPLAET
jgi:hypothetical protein